MNYHDTASLLTALLSTTSTKGVADILSAIGDRPDLMLDEPFGPLGFQWHPFGDNPSNISTIGLGTKPGRSLTERVTNAIDAILEDRVPANIALPSSPRIAAKQWFNRPVSGIDDGLYKWSNANHGLDRRIAVVLLESSQIGAPTIDVWDDGIGIRPLDFHRTILSLQSGNKIKKWYLIGAFGQGGAAALAFCDYTLMISRSKSDPDVVGFTLIRVLNLNETYKEDCYGYLCLKDGSGLRVPECRLGREAVQAYKPISDMRLPMLTKGTLVRHYSYRLSNLAGKLGPSPGNLYHYLHVSLFDPLFPFRLIDLRDERKEKDELVSGSRNRLMRLVQHTETSDADVEEKGSVIRHYRQMEFVTPLGAEDASIGIEYWVVFNYRKGRSGDAEEVILRPQSNELYVQTGHPILGTLNGQNQGELTAHLLKELGLGMVARHIVIHLDATNANSRVRRELFSTSREGFKDGPVLQDLTGTLRNMLEEDDNLYEIERELTERLAKREAESTSQEVKRQVTKLLLEAGLRVRDEGPSFGSGSGSKQTIKPRKTRRYHTVEPLPTLPFPQVTRFEIVAPRDRLQCRINDTELVLVETDADAEFDRRSLIAIRSEPAVLEQAAKAPLRGGRIRWRMRPKTDVKAGLSGRVIVALTKPDGSQLTDEVEFEVVEALEQPAKKEQGFVPPFEIKPINPYDNQEPWSMVWPDLTPEEHTEQELASVAYRAVRAQGGIWVYYSTIFAPLKVQADKLKSESPTLSELFRTNYEIWIGYHAILQENAKNAAPPEIDTDAFERLLEEDRTRVAQIQVKQALRTAELMHDAMKAKGVGESD